MSKVFSLVGLETNTGIRDAGIMSGVPEVEDIDLCLILGATAGARTNPKMSPPRIWNGSRIIRSS